MVDLLSSIAPACHTSEPLGMQKVMLPRVVTEEQLAEVVAKVDQAEAEGRISPWEEGDLPSSLLEEEPEPGSIVSEKDVPLLGGTELVLSNGMQVTDPRILAVSFSDRIGATSNAVLPLQ